MYMYIDVGIAMCIHSLIHIHVFLHIFQSLFLVFQEAHAQQRQVIGAFTAVTGLVVVAIGIALATGLQTVLLLSRRVDVGASFGSYKNGLHSLEVSTTYLSIYLSVCLSNDLSIHLSIYPSIYGSIYLSI